MLLHPSRKTVEYKIEDLNDVELSINELEKIALSDNEINGVTAKMMILEIRVLRDKLALKQGVMRHPKFSTELPLKVSS